MRPLFPSPFTLTLLDLLASGGMAHVYRARVGLEVLAVKRILPHFTQEEELRQLFVDEARVARLLVHPNIVAVHDLVASQAGELFMLMEFAHGRDLADVLHAANICGNRFPWRLALHVAQQVLAALEHSHAARDEEGRPLRVIHRDVSPHNVMLGFEGWVKLTDFGIAKAASSSHLTTVGVLKGKFGYMSPEQARGEPVDLRSDLYNVGILLYEMVTGDRAFAGSSDQSTLRQMRQAQLPQVSPVFNVPPRLEDVMRRALAFLPQDRFESATTFAQALEDLRHVDGKEPAGPITVARLMTQLFGGVIPLPAVGLERTVEVRSLMMEPGPWVLAQPLEQPTRLLRSGLVAPGVTAAPAGDPDLNPPLAPKGKRKRPKRVAGAIRSNLPRLKTP